MNILNPMTWLYGVLALALVGGSGYLYGRSDGKKIERVEWRAKEKRADDKAADKLKTLTEDANKKERAHATALVAISTEYQQELKNERTKKDRLISDLRAGAIRLRDPGTRYSLSPNPLPATGTNTGRCDGDAKAGLSDELIEFFTSEASRADEIVKQLTACQKAINVPIQR